jgi:hypothetical protein
MATTVTGFLILSYTSYTYGQNGIQKCKKGSLSNEGDKCIGEMMQVDDNQTNPNGVCNDDSFKVEGDSCLGAFIQIENPRVNLQLRPTLTSKPHREINPSGIS